jgi:hypothetical protein
MKGEGIKADLLAGVQHRDFMTAQQPAKLALGEAVARRDLGQGGERVSHLCRVRRRSP